MMLLRALFLAAVSFDGLESSVAAGADHATWVGRPTAMDGSGCARGGDRATAGTGGDAEVRWTITRAPEGSAARILDPTARFPVFTPDLPGDYVLEVSSAREGASFSDTATVHVYELLLQTELAGGTEAEVALHGRLAGPGRAELHLEGKHVPLDAERAFGPITVPTHGARLLPLAFEVVHVDGTTARLLRTVRCDAVDGVDVAVDRSLAAHLESAGLARLARAAEESLRSIDAAELVAELPAKRIALRKGPFDATMFSARAKLTGLAFDPDVRVDLAPHAGGIDGKVRFSNVRASFDVGGELMEVGYDLSGELRSDPIELFATLRLSAAPNGALEVELLRPAVVRNRFDFDLRGFVGNVAELVLLESWVRHQVEGALVRSLKTDLARALAELLGSIALRGSLQESLGVDVSFEAKLADVIHTTSGATLLFDSVLADEEPAGRRASSRPSIETGLGSIGAGASEHEAALAASESFVNRVLAAATSAGLLKGDPHRFLPAFLPAEFLTAGRLSAAFPGAGFERLPLEQPVRLLVDGASAPVYRATPGGNDAAVLELADLEISACLPGLDAMTPFLTLAVRGTIGIKPTTTPGGALRLAIGDVELCLDVLQVLPGVDIDEVQASATMWSLYLPRMTRHVEPFVLPPLGAEGFRLAPHAIGAHAGYTALFGALSLQLR